MDEKITARRLSKGSRQPRTKYQRRLGKVSCKLKDHRKLHQLTQAQVAKAVGISVATMVSLEGGAEPRLPIMRKLAEFYEVEEAILWPKGGTRP